MSEYAVGTNRSGTKNTSDTSLKYKRSGTHRHGIADFLDGERRDVVVEVRKGGGGGDTSEGFFFIKDKRPILTHPKYVS